MENGQVHQGLVHQEREHQELIPQQSQHPSQKQIAHLEKVRPACNKARRQTAKQIREEAIRVASVNMVTEFLKVKGIRPDCFEDDAVLAAQPAIASAIVAQPDAQPQPKQRKRSKKHVKPLTPPTTEDESTTQTEISSTATETEIECPQPRKRKHRNLVFEEPVFHHQPRYEHVQRYIEPTRFYSSSSQFRS